MSETLMTDEPSAQPARPSSIGHDSRERSRHERVAPERTAHEHTAPVRHDPAQPAHDPSGRARGAALIPFPAASQTGAAHHSVQYHAHRDPRSSHQQILKAVRDRRARTVLDVGTAGGIFGRLLLNDGLTIDGIELDPERAEQARPFYREVYNTAAELTPLPAKAYDVIICGDVLEHTVDPVGVLRHLRRAAADDAIFMISLPNVAHLAVRALLLFGQFPQMDKGILDRTHLHFYTRRTARAMLVDAGLRVERARATGFPVDEIWRAGERNVLYRAAIKFQHLLLAVVPSLFGWQWVFTARQTDAAITSDRRDDEA